MKPDELYSVELTGMECGFLATCWMMGAAAVERESAQAAVMLGVLRRFDPSVADSVREKFLALGSVASCLP